MSIGATTDIEARLDVKRRRREEIRSVIRLSVPTVITLCSRMFMDIADFFMISRTGAAAKASMAAILPAQITMWTFIVGGFATISIVNTFVAQSLGRNRPQDTSAYAWQGVYLSFVFGAFGLGLWPLLPYIFAAIGHAPKIQALELTYARIGVLSFGVTIASEALSGFFNGLHRPKVTMWTAIEANLINVVVSWVLIFGHFGLPALGIAGAAWGTFVGVVYRFGRLLVTFLSGDFARVYGARRTYPVDFAKMRSILRVGYPNGLQGTSDVLVWCLFVNILIGKMFDPNALVASNVVWQYLRLTFMPSFGVGIAVSALVGKAIGQGDHEMAVRMTRIALWILGGYLATLAMVFLTFRHSLIAVFNSDPEIVRIGASVLVCAAVFQLFDGIGIGFHSALKGAGDTLWPAILFVVSHWLIVVGGGYAMARLFPEWGVLGPWWAAATLIIFLAFILWRRWSGGAWRRVDIFRHEQPAAP